MKRIDNMEDMKRGFVTYEFPNGKRLTWDAREIQRYGVAHILRELGEEGCLPTERLPVRWLGQMIGTFPPDFDPHNIRQASGMAGFLYDPRPGDFTLADGVWEAHRSLGRGDLEGIRGFVYAEGYSSRDGGDYPSTADVFRAHPQAAVRDGEG